MFTLEEENRSVFSINDAKRILGTSAPSVWNVIYRLKKKGRIEEIEKGKYLLIPARAGYEGSWSEVPSPKEPFRFRIGCKRFEVDAGFHTNEIDEEEEGE